MRTNLDSRSYPSGPSILSILPNNSSGYYKKATTTALQLAVANTGSVYLIRLS